MVEYEEFVQWKNHVCTRELKKDVIEAIEAIAAQILNRDFSDLQREQYLKGVMHGLRVLVDWKPVVSDQDTVIREVDLNA